MSRMRDCEYIDYQNGFSPLVVAANELGLKISGDNYQAIKHHIQESCDFDMGRIPGSNHTTGRDISGMWERWTNGQDPIWATYNGDVSFVGSVDDAKKLLADLGIA